MSYLDAHLAKMRLTDDLQSEKYQRYVTAFDSTLSSGGGGARTPAMDSYAPVRTVLTAESGDPRMEPETRIPDSYSVPVPSDLHSRQMLNTLMAAETYAIAPNMQQLVLGAADEMPEEPLLPQDLPSTQGVLFLQEPFTELDVRGRVLREHLVMWSVMSDRFDPKVSGVAINWFTDRDDPLDEVNQELRKAGPNTTAFLNNIGKYALMGANFIRFGQVVPASPDLRVIRELDAQLPPDWHRQFDIATEVSADEAMWRTGIAGAPGASSLDDAHVPVLKPGATLTPEQFDLIRAAYAQVDADGRGVANSLRRLFCFWRLCQQTISAREYAHPDRATSKLLMRRKFSASPVTVITLRRRRPNNTDSATEVEWDHRWLRRGHWRNQWYGSGEDRHQRAIYINPTICGPEDKPLLIRPHVNLLAR